MLLFARDGRTMRNASTQGAHEIAHAQVNGEADTPCLTWMSNVNVSSEQSERERKCKTHDATTSNNNMVHSVDLWPVNAAQNDSDRNKMEWNDNRIENGNTKNWRNENSWAMKQQFSLEKITILAEGKNREILNTTRIVCVCFRFECECATRKRSQKCVHCRIACTAAFELANWRFRSFLTRRKLFSRFCFLFYCLRQVASNIAHRHRYTRANAYIVFHAEFFFSLFLWTTKPDNTFRVMLRANSSHRDASYFRRQRTTCDSDISDMITLCVCAMSEREEKKRVRFYHLSIDWSANNCLIITFWLRARTQWTIVVAKGDRE